MHDWLDAAPLPLPEALVAELRAAYAVPPRAYHDWSHVREVAGHLHRLGADEAWRQPREVFLAACFHDAVYEPGRADNEARSAHLAREAIARHLPRAGLDVDRVAALIELTARHGRVSPGEVDAEAARFLDCDMAILAAPWDRFLAYDRAIAEEYRTLLDDGAYRAARRRFLEHLLRRECIYLSAAGRARWEAAARANLERWGEDRSSGRFQSPGEQFR